MVLSPGEGSREWGEVSSRRAVRRWGWENGNSGFFGKTLTNLCGGEQFGAGGPPVLYRTKSTTSVVTAS
jgi:hypothetical protein